MDQTKGSTRVLVGAILAIVGGALLAIGSFLAWAEVAGGGTSVTERGIEGSHGAVTLAAGAAALLVGISMTRRAERMLAALVIVAGIVGCGIGLYNAFTTKDAVLDTAAEKLARDLGTSAEQARTALDTLIEAGEFSVSIGIGLYVVIAGGFVALVGGILSLGGSRAGSMATPGTIASVPPPAVVAEDESVPPAPTPPQTASLPADEAGA
jgi:hypothetical protein